MAKGANGTIDLASFTQLQRQREAFGDRNPAGKSFGVARNRLTPEEGELFPDSPLLTSVRQGYTGIYLDADGDVYKAFANVVDSSNAINGFGFEGSNQVNLNYQHENNPFKDDINALTKGIPADLVDNSGSSKRYLGFPDLKPVDDLGNPQEPQSSTATLNLNRSANNNFGSSVQQDRDALNVIYSTVGSDQNETPDQRGTYESDRFSSDDSDKIGKYFKNVMAGE